MTGGNTNHYTTADLQSFCKSHSLLRFWDVFRGVAMYACTACSMQLVFAKRPVGSQGPLKNLGSHIDASHSRQPLVKGERLVRYEVNAVMQKV